MREGSHNHPIHRARHARIADARVGARGPMSVLRIPLTGRIIAEMLRALLENATPGPWEPFNGHVSALKDDVPAQYDVLTEDEQSDLLAYYGGDMVCESCNQADGALIAAVRNLLPALLDAYG